MILQVGPVSPASLHLERDGGELQTEYRFGDPVSKKKAALRRSGKSTERSSATVFVGQRAPMTDCGIRALCRKFSAVIGVRLHPHVFRHTMAKQFLADNGNDLVSLAQILGHENLQTTSRYSQRNAEQLGEASERLGF